MRRGHRRATSDGDSHIERMRTMRMSAVDFGFDGQHATTRLGKSKLKYCFTMENVLLACGSALLQPSSEAQAPTVSLTWTSSKKKVFGGVVRALPPHEGSGARWTRPVSLGCSLHSNSRSAQRFEARPSTITLRIEGTKASRRKLVGTLDLAQYASYERTSTRLTIPLEHGAGSLQLDLTAGWLKRSVLDDDQGSDGSLSRVSDSTGAGSGSDDDGACSVTASDMGDAVGSGLRGGANSLGALPEEEEEGAGGGRPHHPSTTSTPTKKGGAGGGHGSGAGNGSGDGTPTRAPMLRSGSFESKGMRRLGGGRKGLTVEAATMRRGSAEATVPDGTSPADRAARAAAASSSSSDGAAAAGGGGLKRSNSFGSSATRHAGAEGGSGSIGNGAHAPGSGGGGGGNGHGDAEEPLVGRSTSLPSSGGGSHHGGSHCTPGGGSSSGSSATGLPPGTPSIFGVPIDAMEEVLHLQLPMALEQLQESFAGFDTEDSRFGQMLSRRLGYMEVRADAWAGNEAEGMVRSVKMVVKCPPKPMLPDTTRVHIRHRLQRLSAERLVLEREVATLDVPYGETWSLQERWIATADPAMPEQAVELVVRAHIYFKSRGMLSAKIKTHALKRSRKCAALAAELLETVALPDDEPALHGGGAAESADGHIELLALREAHAALLEEAAFHKRQADMYRRENARLEALAKGVKKGKRELLQKIAELEATIAKERREHAALEVTLSEAYTSTLKEILGKQAEAENAGGGQSRGGSPGKAGNGSGPPGKPAHKPFSLFR